MRVGHLLVRCGPYRILVPGGNVAAIEEAGDGDLATVSIRLSRRRGWPLVMDGRALLGIDPAHCPAARVNLFWRSHDDRRRAVLRVDAADSLRHEQETTLLPLPRVPRAVRDLFDGLVRDDRQGFLLRLRADVSPELQTARHRRRFARAVLGALPPTHIFNRGEP